MSDSLSLGMAGVISVLVTSAIKRRSSSSLLAAPVSARCCCSRSLNVSFTAAVDCRYTHVVLARCAGDDSLSFVCCNEHSVVSVVGSFRSMTIMHAPATSHYRHIRHKSDTDFSMYGKFIY